jgi:DNA-binding MarR family transcriptional regulator
MPPVKRVVALSPSDAALELREACERMVVASLRLARIEANELGLSVPQVFLLQTLAETDTVPIAQLVARSGNAPATIGGILEGLATAGLVRRERGIDDRRQVWVSLTPEGREMVARLEARRARVWRPIEEKIRRRDAAVAAQALGEVAGEFSGVKRSGDESARQAVLRVHSEIVTEGTCK